MRVFTKVFDISEEFTNVSDKLPRRSLSIFNIRHILIDNAVLSGKFKNPLYQQVFSEGHEYFSYIIILKYLLILKKQKAKPYFFVTTEDI